MKDGYAQNIESKLKALDLAFELDSKIKQIEENLKSKEVERNRQIAEMKQFLEASDRILTLKSKVQLKACKNRLVNLPKIEKMLTSQTINYCIRNIKSKK